MLVSRIILHVVSALQSIVRKQKASSVYINYDEQHGEVTKDLLRPFGILKKCRNKSDCLVNELLFIRDLKPTLNVQSDSIRSKVFIFN